MDGRAKKLVKFLAGDDKRFIVPVYQRNYSWKTENCKQLYDDLVKLSRSGGSIHFFGSIVSVYNGVSEDFLIIDGQQRITTVSLLLLAIHNILKRGKLVAEDSKLIDKVYNKYLVDEYDESERRIKLKTINQDYEAFEKLFDDEPSDFIQNSDITINYNYFYDRILKEELTIDDLYDAICKLMIISITVEKDDNPQLIFESLNSTGVDLTEGDKIRNYVLMGQTPENQKNFYKKYWSKIEACTGNDNNNNNGVSMFVRDYLSIKRHSTPSIDKIYSAFKTYVSEKGISIENLLIDLLDYARLYRILTKSEFNDPVVNSCIQRLNYLENTVSRPFFIQVLHLYKEEILKKEDLEKIFLIVENYLFRRNICEVPTNALNKIFLTLNREVYRFENSYDNYVGKMVYALTSKKESGRFPDDKEFATALSEKQVYLMRGHFKNYLFERYENYGTDEVKDVYQRIENGDYSIEHIMPRTLTPTWEKALGDNYEEIHETWIHRLANLTLVSIKNNISYSNNDFIDKRDAENGFKNSGLRINNWIAQRDKWTLTELEDRDNYMVSKAQDIWNYPTSNYRPEEKQFDSVTLDDDMTFTGSVIAKFAYKDTEQTVDSWTEMYGIVLRMLHSEDNSVFTRLAYTTDPNVELAIHVSNNPDDFISKVKIADNIYVWTGTGTQYKINNLRKFFAMFGTDPSDLVFYLKDKDDPSNDDNSPERYPIRKKYWAFALPYIKAIFGKHETFQKVNPSISNWIAGFYGVGGFNITCIANYDCARVQFYLGSVSKEKNKEAYDYLYEHKSEIEKRIGEKIRWERMDDNKASYMIYELPGVSVTNETDWIQMAKFHAEWSYKMCDAMLPVLSQQNPDVIWE